ncbi:MAG: hypothetical protein KDB79_03340 [Acidobacteria bacterium]|nr:hypothetical protein [Acidobacteriota bacterium]
MLNSTALINSGAQTSKNPFFKQLYEEVVAYNAIPGTGALQQKADQLLKVCRLGGCYCTGKPPQPPKSYGGKNGPRWAAIKDMLDQVGTEVTTLGLRMLHGPSDFKKIGGNVSSYWLELIDPQHRAGHVLTPQFALWMKDANAITTKTSFWDYIGTDNSGLIEDAAVKYYPELKEQDYDLRAGSKLHFNNDGLLVDYWDDPWDTYSTETHFTGKGWGVFVVSPKGKIYGGNHIAGEHHHSSFLAGGMVKAAGEMACFDGVPRFITAKSGHYKPTSDNLRNWVNTCPQIRGDALILPGWGTPPKFHTVDSFRVQGEMASVLSKDEVTRYLTVHHKAASIFSRQAKAKWSPGKGNYWGPSYGFKDVWDDLEN